MKTYCYWAYGLLLALISHAAQASLSVAPTQLELGPGQRNTSLQVRNTSEQPRNIQVLLLRWTQDGKDRYEDSNELAYFPKLLTLDAQSSRTIRIGLLQAADGDQEVAYRLAVRELPDLSSSNSPVNFASQIRVPVFVGGSEDTGTSWAISELKQSGQQFSVTISNQGRQHIRIREISVQAHDADEHAINSLQASGWRVLAGGRYDFTLTPAEHASLCANNIASLLVTAHSQDAGEQSRRFARADVCLAPTP